MSGASRWAVTTFVALFLIHFLDYVDRWTLTSAPVATSIQRELEVSDGQFGSLNTFFLITFSLVSPLTGYAGDRFRRTWLLAGGVGLWSVATVGTGLVENLTQLRLARAVLGIGEATYGVIAPSLLMDLFRRQTRSRILAAFYLAMPLGYAAGVWGGGKIALGSVAWFEGTALEAWAGWRMAFFVVGLPGLLAALGMAFLPEPTRGASEEVDPDRAKAHEQSRPTAADYRDLLVNSSYTYVVFGMASFTFAFGGLAYWLPKYLATVKDFGEDKANNIVAMTILPASIAGMALGGWLADWLSKRSPRALFLVPGCAFLLAAPCVLVGLFSDQEWVIRLSLFSAAVLMLSHTGPCNAIIANVITPNMRATAYAVAIFCLHMFGDVWSPMLMGWTSDYFGDPELMATGIGRFLASIGVTPTRDASGEPHNLAAGMLVVVPAIVLGGCVLLAGSRHLPREMALMLAKLRAAPRPESSTPTTPPSS